MRSCEHVWGNQFQSLLVQGRGYDECCAKTSSEGSGILTKGQRDKESRVRLRECQTSKIFKSPTTSASPKYERRSKPQ